MCKVKWTEYLSNVEAKPRRWLWPQRIPLGEITLLAGIQGMGKSLLTSKIAAHVTNGGAWPDGSPCDRGSVVLLQAEDSAEHTVLPRYEAVGVDTTRVRIIYGVPGKRSSDALLPFNLSSDMPRLAWAVENTEGVRLVIIDPVGSYIGGIDIHRENHVRAVMYQLKMHLAERYGVSVLVVVHLRKGGAEDPVLCRVLGSVAFTGAARTVWGVAHAEDDPDLRYLVPMKHNLTSSRAVGREFTIETAPNGEGRVRWGPECRKSAEDVMKDHGATPQSKVDKAMEIMQTELQAGAVSAKKIKEKMLLEGISWRTANKAKTELNIKSVKVHDQWFWSLPGSDK